MDKKLIAKNWWHNTLSINEQNALIKKHAPLYSPDHMRGVIYNKNNKTIVDIWEKEGSPVFSDFLNEKYGHGYLSDKDLGNKISEKYNTGGEIKPETKMEEEIKKLKAVVNSKNIGEALKAKAQAQIDMLEEKARKTESGSKSKPSSSKTKSSPKKPTANQKKKVSKVMKEFKEGDLTSHGKKVKNKKQAVAIALSEAGMSKNKKKAETVFGYAKRTQKSGEAWKEAIKRASKELKNGGKPVAKKIKRTERKPKPVAKKIKRTPTKSNPTKTAKVIKRVKYLNGETKKSVDKKTVAMHPGKRISKSGSTYYEYRANRADLNKTKKLAEGGEVSSDFAKGGSLRKPKFEINDMVYSYQNPDDKARVSHRRDDGVQDNIDYGFYYKVNLTDKDGYSRSSKWMSEKSMSKTKKNKY